MRSVVKLALPFLLIMICLNRKAQSTYTMVPKQFNDSLWYMVQSTYFDTNFTQAQQACANYGLELAEIHSASDYSYLASLFCASGS